VRLHVGLVGWLLPRFERRGLENEDLHQEAMAGLLRAVRRFQVTRGTRFSTYAGFWIRASLERAVADSSRLVRLPVHLHERLVRLQKENSAFERQHKRRPEIEELAAIVGIEADRVRHLASYLRYRSVPIDGDDEDEEGRPSLGRVLAGSLPSPDESLLVTADRARLDAALSGLRPKEREVIVRRFGLDGQPELTLEDVGAMFGVTRERIRQIQKKALSRLHHTLKWTPE
jgi:RNA polymerase primary sigma factor